MGAEQVCQQPPSFVQKYRGIARNLEAISEELQGRSATIDMSKLNHKNGNHGDGKLEEEGLIDPENKIGKKLPNI